MSSSRLPTSRAMLRNAARSIWRAPGKVVCRSEGCIGTQSLGSRESHMKPRASGTSDSCGKYVVGWYAPRRARCIHAWKRVHSAGRHRSATRTLRPSAARNSARRRAAPGCEGGPGYDVAPACGSKSGIGAARSSSTEARSRLRWLAHRLRLERAASTAARMCVESCGPSAM
eukprot:scaffold1772_cov97-Phaeocystis_antarctica.AAC.3